MKCIIDTNVIFSALYNMESNSGDLLFLAINGAIELIAPETVKEELIRNLRNKLNYSEEEIEETIQALPITWIDSLVYDSFMKVAPEYIGHENDYPIIACALALNVDIVTGNKHFHPLKKKIIIAWGVRELVTLLLNQESAEN
ncbi:MAG TPA: PIN domain-containing protein [Candidatus Lokiarchaeia archaeon]|nr:PIN domain-containing protein [Candidatus Lokiarchaeia archaeon]